MKITTSAYNEMLKTVGSRPAESGGLLFGSRKDWVITTFLYDKNATTTSTSYSFDVGYLNPKIEELGEQGLQLLGFFHSHPQGAKKLSLPDIEYFTRQFKNIPVDKFIVPLMFPAVDGKYDFIPYMIHKEGTVEQTELEILPDRYEEYLNTEIEAPISKPEAIANSDIVTAKEYQQFLWQVLLTALTFFAVGTLWELYNYLSHLLNTNTYGF